MFQWLRLKVRNAVLGGIADAIEYLEKQGASASDDALGLLEERIRLLPVPSVEEAPERPTGARKGKAG